MSRMYEIDGEKMSTRSIQTEARVHGITDRHIITGRLNRGDRTRARLFRPVATWLRHNHVTSRDEVAEAIKALDSRPRLWTGY